MPKNFWIYKWSDQVCGISQARLRPGKNKIVYSLFSKFAKNRVEKDYKDQMDEIGIGAAIIIKCANDNDTSSIILKTDDMPLTTAYLPVLIALNWIKNGYVAGTGFAGMEMSHEQFHQECINRKWNSLIYV